MSVNFTWKSPAPHGAVNFSSVRILLEWNLWFASVLLYSFAAPLFPFSNDSGKVPYCLEVGDGSIFAFAGLWDRWQAPDGTAVESCTILTTTPNELLSDVHNRMPVILFRDRYRAWLDPGIQDEFTALQTLKPFQASLMRWFPVSAMVNRVTNDGPECSAPVELPAATGSLFE